jgi:RNA polymerase sigma factor (sigma-70 family)
MSIHTILDESALIASARGGDVEAFNQLVLAYRHLAYNHALHMLNDPQAADDAVQEAVISAYRHLSGFRGGCFRNWLLRIVTNACYDELRHRRARRTTPLEPAGPHEHPDETQVWMTDPGETPEAAVLRSELRRAIHCGLASLLPEYRAALVLVDILGLDYAEAAAVLACPLGTVKSRLARARTRLCACLQDTARAC